MNIGADWLARTMLSNPVSRIGNAQSQIGTGASDTSNLFVNVLTQFLKQQELQTATPSQMNAFIPDFFSSIPSSINTQNLPLNTQNSLIYQPISSESLNQVLSGKLTGMGETFVRAGQRFNVNPALLAAISQHETGNGKSNAAIEKNNVAGMMGNHGLKSYASIEDSIMDMAQNLSKNYLGKGLSSIATIGSKYAPIGAGNDPTGLNNHWVTGVNKYFNQFFV
ncbi:glucosaminidase domain-containing protein [Bacillus sp. 1NLA3E]|uniref:glucosaminidase domain-containing protein n=1 Tax=Bacillus sp. 1NLA3E TaxID=666686 RepID=UPI000247F323|nr:glucosaminidase domain-containing protein [Bacillus sp. 1NLA3E]AGK55374.1 Peptidase, M23/M37 family protein [Bacillus sp. 1NLA3E]